MWGPKHAVVDTDAAGRTIVALVGLLSPSRLRLSEPELMVIDAEGRKTRALTGHGNTLTPTIAVDAGGRFVVTGDAEGVVAGRTDLGRPAARPAGPQRAGQPRGRVARWQVDRVRLGCGDQVVADAGSLDAAVPPTAVRATAREAALAHQPARGRRPFVGDRLSRRGRPVPGVEGRADLVSAPRPFGRHTEGRPLRVPSRLAFVNGRRHGLLVARHTTIGDDRLYRRVRLAFPTLACGHRTARRPRPRP